MSRENVEVVRLILAAWKQGDFGSQLELFHPEIEFETFMPDATENVVVQGSAEFAAFTRDWLSQRQSYRIVDDEFREVGPDKVFVAVRQLATGRHSGVEVESPGFSVWRLRGGGSREAVSPLRQG